MAWRRTEPALRPLLPPSGAYGGDSLLGHGQVRLLDARAGRILTRLLADRGAVGTAIAFLDRDAALHCLYPADAGVDDFEVVAGTALSVITASSGLTGALFVTIDADAGDVVVERHLESWRATRRDYDGAGVALVDWLVAPPGARSWARSMADTAGSPSWWRRDRDWQALRRGPAAA